MFEQASVTRIRPPVQEFAPEETPSIAAVAQKCMRDCDNNLHDAQKLMERLVAGHPPLFRDLMTPLLATACYDALRSVVRTDRGKVWTAPNYTKAGNGSRLETLGVTLLDFPLPSGIRLRNASKADVLEGARFYSAQAADMQHKAKWLEAIAAKVGNRTVGEKFTAEKLQALQEATK